MDALCAMHENGRSGEITGTVDELSRVCRCSPSQMQSAIEELERTGAAEVDAGCHGDVTLSNRRMARDAQERERNRKRKEKQRSRSSQKGGSGVSPESGPDVSRTCPGTFPFESENESEVETEADSHRQRNSDSDCAWDCPCGQRENSGTVCMSCHWTQDRTLLDLIAIAPPRALTSPRRLTSVWDDATAMTSGRTILNRYRRFLELAGGKRGSYVKSLVKWIEEGCFNEPDEAWKANVPADEPHVPEYQDAT